MLNADTVMEMQRAIRTMNTTIDIANNRRTQLQDWELNFIRNGIQQTILTLQQIDSDLTPRG